MSLFNLTGKVAVVTGSSRGIGRSIALQLAKQGAKVVVSSRKQDACEVVVKEIQAAGGEAMAIAASISSKEQLQNLIAKTRETWGVIDILVCNAATNPYYGPTTGMSDEVFDKVMRNNVLANTEVSQFAPRLYTMKINPEKIRDVIGKGGATIRALTEETGTTIDIGEDGTITIASTDADKAEHAKKRIQEITAEVEIGKVYEGPITKILDFGALVNLLPGKDGLLHISQIAHQRVEKVTDFLSEGQIVKVKVLETDEKGRIKLSMKALIERDAAPAAEAPQQ
eukprot:gene40746-50413_t